MIGFQEHAYMAPIGMADLGAGGDFPHRIAPQRLAGDGRGPGAEWDRRHAAL